MDWAMGRFNTLVTIPLQYLNIGFMQDVAWGDSCRMWPGENRKTASWQLQIWYTVKSLFKPSPWKKNLAYRSHKFLVPNMCFCDVHLVQKISKTFYSTERHTKKVYLLGWGPYLSRGNCIGILWQKMKCIRILGHKWIHMDSDHINVFSACSNKVVLHGSPILVFLVSGNNWIHGFLQFWKKCIRIPVF